MNIDAKQLANAPKKVGTLRGENIMEIATKGGLHLIVGPKGKGFETLGTGPHRAVARHIAKKHAPDIVWNTLEKSDHVAFEHYSPLLPKYEAITTRLRQLHGDE